MGSSELEKRGSDTRIYQPMIVRTADMSTGSNKMQYIAAGAGKYLNNNLPTLIINILIFSLKLKIPSDGENISLYQ